MWRANHAYVARALDVPADGFTVVAIEDAAAVAAALAHTGLAGDLLTQATQKARDVTPLEPLLLPYVLPVA